MPVTGTKRTSDALVPVEPKRPKASEVAVYTARDKALLEAGVKRTSSLLSPIMALEGHQGEIFSAEFHPEGKHLVSTGFDRQICKLRGFCNLSESVTQVLPRHNLLFQTSGKHSVNVRQSVNSLATQTPLWKFISHLMVLICTPRQWINIAPCGMYQHVHASVN